MFIVSQERFEEFVANALDSLPERYQKRLNNLVIVVEDEPNEDQRQKLKLHPNSTLFGLYEGIPLTKRGANYSLVLPDKITIFKKPSEFASHSLESLKEQIRYTVWHEVAHYYGLNHSDIDAKE